MSWPEVVAWSVAILLLFFAACWFLEYCDEKGWGGDDEGWDDL